MVPGQTDQGFDPLQNWENTSQILKHDNLSWTCKPFKDFMEELMWKAHKTSSLQDLHEISHTTSGFTSTFIDGEGIVSDNTGKEMVHDLDSGSLVAVASGGGAKWSKKSRSSK